MVTEGFEPPTPSFSGRRSTRLSYVTVSGRWGSNPRHQLGRLGHSHYTTPARLGLSPRSSKLLLRSPQPSGRYPAQGIDHSSAAMLQAPTRNRTGFSRLRGERDTFFALGAQGPTRSRTEFPCLQGKCITDNALEPSEGALPLSYTSATASRRDSNPQPPPAS